ncbi:hypothetical protein E2562_016487 [Oryza meyeriana var. granulata]|uniref:Uncharacterized protein n=1 Tax=Oryza meyeriana var. granulata TaxID=110450 RepID=A0A6G1BLL5_9ORYZ|nr:hypothetical protein E2562_016487 [Oryza meyeriana var. granulata]
MSRLSRFLMDLWKTQWPYGEGIGSGSCREGRQQNASFSVHRSSDEKRRNVPGLGGGCTDTV